jgi:hypothetical protein
MDYRSVGQKYLGSPFRVCNRCHNKYIDNNFVEAALLTKKDFILSFPWLRSIMNVGAALFFIAPALFFLFTGGFEIELLICLAVGVLFLIIPIKQAVTLVKYVTLKDEDLLQEIEESKERLSNPEYVLAIWDAGAYVTKEILDWANNAVKKTTQKPETPTNISVSSSTDTDTFSFCRKCGTQIDDDSIFCRKCGTKIKETNNDLQ